MPKTATRTTILTVLLFSASLLALPAIGSGLAEVTGGAPKSSRGFPSVVALSPTGGTTGDAPTEPVSMDQVDKKFVPNVLIARVGQPVTFRNGEDMLHNVHVISLANNDTLLNIAQPIYGMSANAQFDEVGGYAVLCDVHPEMEAYVVVVDTEYAVVADAEGNFSLDVPPGEYDLTIWNVNEAKQHTGNLSVSAEGATIQ